MRGAEGRCRKERARERAGHRRHVQRVSLTVPAATHTNGPVAEASHLTARRALKDKCERGRRPSRIASCARWRRRAALDQRRASAEAKREVNFRRLGARMSTSVGEAAETLARTGPSPRRPWLRWRLAVCSVCQVKLGEVTARVWGREARLERPDSALFGEAWLADLVRRSPPRLNATLARSLSYTC